VTSSQSDTASAEITMLTPALADTAEKATDLPPPKAFKILKRPSSIPNNLEQQTQTDGSQVLPSLAGAEEGSGGGDVLSPSSGENSKSSHKSLKQREEEYAQARLRILGSAEPVTAEAPATQEDEGQPEVNSPQSATSGTIPVIDQSLANKNIVRHPSGPDGTKGFKLKG